jgi:hypothetical protein
MGAVRRREADEAEQIVDANSAPKSDRPLWVDRGGLGRPSEGFDRDWAVRIKVV